MCNRISAILHANAIPTVRHPLVRCTHRPCAAERPVCWIRNLDPVDEGSQGVTGKLITACLLASRVMAAYRSMKWYTKSTANSETLSDATIRCLKATYVPEVCQHAVNRTLQCTEDVLVRNCSNKDRNLRCLHTIYTMSARSSMMLGVGVVEKPNS